MKHGRAYGLVVLAGAMVAVALPSAAQLDNKPYGFKNAPGGGLGMSRGGQQAILEEKIYGLRPDNLLRDSSGSLMDLRKGPGGAALASRPGDGGFIPRYHGTSFKGNVSGMDVGVFNSFFVPSGDHASTIGTGYGDMQSWASINSWTSMVVAGGSGAYAGSWFLTPSSVDLWTLQVPAMGDR